MTRHITLADRHAVTDLRTLLERARRLDPDGAVHLRGFAAGGGAVLVASVAPVVPHGLLDATPTVLGARTFLASLDAAGGGFDAVSPIGAILERIAHLDVTEGLDLLEPPAGVSVPWAAVSAPRSGWAEVARVASPDLVRVAREGVARVSEGYHPDAGEALVHELRSRVWGETPDVLAGLPAGAAFAAEGLGFARADELEDGRVLRSGAWWRLALRRGDVLVRPPFAR